MGGRLQAAVRQGRQRSGSHRHRHPRGSGADLHELCAGSAEVKIHAGKGALHQQRALVVAKNVVCPPLDKMSTTEGDRLTLGHWRYHSVRQGGPGHPQRLPASGIGAGRQAVPPSPPPAGGALWTKAAPPYRTEGLTVMYAVQSRVHSAWAPLIHRGKKISAVI